LSISKLFFCHWLDVGSNLGFEFLIFLTFIVKNPFGLFSDTSFQLSVIYKSYRQVLTPINNSQFLLKLEILGKLRLVTFHKWQHKESATLELVHTSSGEMQVLMTLIHKASK
jgi:hypothetical protein